MTLPFAALCPHCGREIESSTAIVENPYQVPEPSPSDGAVTICSHCGQFAIFDRGMLREPRPSESRRIARDQICAAAARLIADRIKGAARYS
jgi:hypothetical protein